MTSGHRDKPNLPADWSIPAGYVLLYMISAFFMHWRFFPVGDIGVETDFYGELAVAARQLWQGDFSVLNYPYKGPVYSLVLQPVHAVVSWLGGDWYRSGVVLNTLCAGGGLLLLYRTLLPSIGRHASLAVMITTSLVYEFFFHAHKGSSDLLFFVLYLGAVNRLVAGPPTRLRIAQSAVLAGAAYLTRYNGVILPVSTVLILLILPPAPLPKARRLRLAALHLGVFLLTIAPWYALNLAETGRLSNTRNLQNIFVEQFRAPREAPAAGTPDPDAAPDRLADVLKSNTGGAVLRYLRNVPDHLNRDLRMTLGWPLGLLALAGLGWILYRRPDPPLRTVYLMHAAYFLAMCLVYHQPRFFFPLLPGYLCAAMVLLFGGPATRRRPATAAAAILVVILAAWQVRTLVAGERYYVGMDQSYVLAPAKSIADATPPGTRIMSRKPHLAFYADRKWLTYPALVGGASHLIAAAYAAGADILLTTDVERYYYPRKTFLDHLDNARGLTRVYSDAHVIAYALDHRLDVEQAVQNRIVIGFLAEMQAAEADGHVPEAIEAAAAAGRALLEDQEYEAARDYLVWAIETAETLEPDRDLAVWMEALRADCLEIDSILGKESE